VRTYLIPHDSCLTDTPRAIGVKVGHLLDALGDLHHHIASGRLVVDCDQARQYIISELKREGWRVRVNRHDKWTVLPPVDCPRPMPERDQLPRYQPLTKGGAK